jgi:peptidoglycan/LPS O-acetylase OafA/YrhL
MLLALSAALAFSGIAVAAGSVSFDGSPGTKAPPATLRAITMTKVKRDQRRLNRLVSLVTGPTGNISFSVKLVHFRVKHSSWQTWSNGYHGDVYYVSNSVTITLPAKTDAFYFYAEPNDQKRFRIRASTTGASSGAVRVHGNAGAKYFGFAATGGALLTSITVSSNDVFNRHKHQQGGFAIGELGIHGTQP